MTSTVPVLVPEGKSCTDLTMGELDAASFQLKADVADCLTGEQFDERGNKVGGVPGKRYAALVELAYRWAKRDNPKAKREEFRDYDMEDIARALRMGEEPEGEDGEPDPTSAGSGTGSSESP